MKISFVEPHLKIYGGIRRIIEISNHLTARGHDVTIFHSDGKPREWMECVAKIKSHNELLLENHDVIIYNDPNTTDYELVKKANAKLKVFITTIIVGILTYLSVTFLSAKLVNYGIVRTITSNLKTLRGRPVRA